jgi:hypothetical protein
MTKHTEETGVSMHRKYLSLASIDPKSPAEISFYEATAHDDHAVGASESDKSLLHDKSSNSAVTIKDAHIYWLYPAIMGLSLLAGLILAVSHHFYYRWLNGQPVGSVARQQWSLR